MKVFMCFKQVLKIDIDKKRVFGLDILRALAIMFVVLGHGNLRLPLSVGHKLDFFLFDGVSIFFVLSGFLIGGIIIKILQQNIIDYSTLYNFWTRRWLRTLPNYAFILTLLTVLNVYFVKGFKLSEVFPYLFFLQNINEARLVFFDESWSLSVEEWFYLLVPPILFALARLRLNYKWTVLGIAIFLILTVTIIRYNRYYNCPIPNSRGDWGTLFYFPVVTRIDSIMFGLVGAFISIHQTKNWVKYKMHFLVIGIGLFIIDKFVFMHNPDYSSAYNCVFSFTVLSVATLMLLPFLSELKRGEGFVYKIITYISLTSYSMYLINNSLINGWGVNFLTSIFNHLHISLSYAGTSVINYSFFLSVTAVGSILLYKYWELPFMRLRDKKNN